MGRTGGAAVPSPAPVLLLLFLLRLVARAADPGATPADAFASTGAGASCPPARVAHPPLTLSLIITSGVHGTVFPTTATGALCDTRLFPGRDRGACTCFGGAARRAAAIRARRERAHAANHAHGAVASVLVDAGSYFFGVGRVFDAFSGAASKSIFVEMGYDAHAAARNDFDHTYEAHPPMHPPTHALPFRARARAVRHAYRPRPPCLPPCLPPPQP